MSASKVCPTAERTLHLLLFRNHIAVHEQPSSDSHGFVGACLAAPAAAITRCCFESAIHHPSGGSRPSGQVPELATPATDEAAALSLAWFRGVRAADDRPTGLSELEPSLVVDAGSRASAAAAGAGSSTAGACAAGRAAAAAGVQVAVPDTAESAAERVDAAAASSVSAGAAQPPSAPQTPLGIPSLPLQRPCSSDCSLSNAALTDSPSLEALASAEAAISAVASMADVASPADAAAAAADVQADAGQVQPAAPPRTGPSPTASGPEHPPPLSPPMIGVQRLGRQLQKLSALPPPPPPPPPSPPPAANTLHTSTAHRGVPPPAPPRAPYPGRQPGAHAGASPRAFPQPPPPPPVHAPPATPEAYHQMVALQVSHDCPLLVPFELSSRHQLPWSSSYRCRLC